LRLASTLAERIRTECSMLSWTVRRMTLVRRPADISAGPIAWVPSKTQVHSKLFPSECLHSLCREG
jgi:hypothetical protein